MNIQDIQTLKHSIKYDNWSEDLIENEYSYFYRDNNADILAVCHADIVTPLQDCKVVAYDEDCLDYVFSPYLDDYLGIFTLLHYLPKYFPYINYDILITNFEEIGQSTMQDFVNDCSKDYNWIVQFDRRGEDVVTYQYSHKKFNKALNKHFKVGHGSCSDISKAEALETMAFNVGIGYHKEHQINCYANLNEYVRQINRFVNFYNEYCDRNFPFAVKEKSVGRVTYFPADTPVHSMLDTARDNEVLEVEKCQVCDKPLTFYQLTTSQDICDECLQGFEKNTNRLFANH